MLGLALLDPYRDVFSLHEILTTSSDFAVHASGIYNSSDMVDSLHLVDMR